MSAGSVWLGRGGDGGMGNSWTRRRSKLVEIAIDGQWSEVKKASLSRPPGLDRPLTACVRFLNGKVFDFRVPAARSSCSPNAHSKTPILTASKAWLAVSKSPQPSSLPFIPSVHRESSQLQALRATLHAIAITNRRLPRAPFETLRMAK